MCDEYNKLIRRLEKRDAKAFKELFDRFFERSYCLAYTYVLDPDIAKDIVQEVFISFYDHSSVLGSITNLPGYINISVRNRCLNYLRDLDLEDHNLRLYYEHILCVSASDDSEELTDLAKKLERALPYLPESCRKICEMRFKGGMKIKSIAEELNISISTVKVQLHRAVSKIRGI